MNGNGIIDTNDNPQGALFFAHVDTGYFQEGENRVSIKLKNKYGKEKQHSITVQCGPKLEYYETDNSFLPRACPKSTSFR